MYYTERSVASRRNLDFLPLRFLRASYELCYPFLCFEPVEQRADVSSNSRELYAFADLPLDDNHSTRGRRLVRSSKSIANADHLSASFCLFGRAPLFFSNATKRRSTANSPVSVVSSLPLRHVLPTFAWHRAFVFIRSLAVQGVECRATRYNPFCWRTFSYLRPSSDSPPGSSHRAPLPSS